MKHPCRTLFVVCLAAAIFITCVGGKTYGQVTSLSIHIYVREMCGSESVLARKNTYEIRVDGNPVANDLGVSVLYEVAYGSHTFSLARNGQPIVIRRAINGSGVSPQTDKVYEGGGTSINIPINKDSSRRVQLEVDVCGSSSKPKTPGPTRPRTPMTCSAKIQGIRGDV